MNCNHMNKTFIICTFSFTSALGLAQSNQFSAARESTFNPTQFAVELKPLPLSLSASPGVASAGAGIELNAGGNVATFLDWYVLNANLPNNLRNKNRESDVPVVQKMEGYSANAGVRYYARPIGLDSWYGGGKVGYMLAMGQWGYQEEKVDQEVRTINPGLEGGYRWMWPSNLLVRLGGGIDANIVQKNEASAVDAATAVTNDASEKIEGYARAGVLPRADIGVGYTF